MTKHNIIIFDLDGTLIDGTEGILSAVQYTIETCNLDKLSYEKLVKFIGPPIQDSFKMTYHLSEMDAQRYANIFRERYKKEDVFKSKVYDGIFDLLNELKTKGYKLGIATYKRTDYAKDLLKFLKLDKYFDCIYGADNENKLKKIDIMQKCIAKLSNDKTSVIMIGDSCHDAIASFDLNVDFIAVTYGFGFKNENDLLQYNSIFIAHNINDLIHYFKNEV